MFTLVTIATEEALSEEESSTCTKPWKKFATIRFRWLFSVKHSRGRIKTLSPIRKSFKITKTGFGMASALVRQITCFLVKFWRSTVSFGK